jgi:hypothetical protein
LRRQYYLRVWKTAQTNLKTCTLLGPEGPTTGISGGPALGSGNTGRKARVSRYRPSFENYTVDASILEREFIHVLDI